MKIYPAIDILGGAAVRLSMGEYSTAETYSSDPAAVAEKFASAGAEYLHIVDLDGAARGDRVNGELIRRIVASTGLKAEVGGGIRDEAGIEYYLSAGAEKVILGTAAVADPEFFEAAVKKYGAAIVAGADIKGGKVAIKGWTETGEADGEEFVARLASIGVKRALVTDVSRDGKLSGCNTELYKRLSALPIEIAASGGVCSADDVVALAEAGAHAAIVGKALYEGKLDLRAAISAAKGGRYAR